MIIKKAIYHNKIHELMHAVAKGQAHNSISNAALLSILSFFTLGRGTSCGPLFSLEKTCHVFSKENDNQMSLTVSPMMHLFSQL